MIQFRKHILSKLFVFSIIFTLLLPSVIKLLHAKEHSKHIVCKGGDEIHFHEVDFDSCDLCKFNLTNYLYTSQYAIEAFIASSVKEKQVKNYTFFNNHKQLSFSLRGPPALFCA
jgi:hypothetical protein